MRIAIIGGSGLIGQALSKELNENGHQVTILSRKANPEQTTNSVQWRQWDGKEAGNLAKILAEQDGVVNLAGISIGKGRWTAKRKQELYASRLEPAAAIVKAWNLAIKKPEVLVQASAIGFYGTGFEPMNETAPCGQDFLARFSQDWEAASAGVVATGVRRVVIRTGVVLARGEGVLPQLTLPFRMFVGGPIGSGRQWLSWVHLQDEVRAIRFLLEAKASRGIYNLTAPNPVTNSEMGKTLARVMRRPYWFPVPGFVLKLALGEMSTLVLDGQKVLPEKLLAAGFIFKFSNVESALKNLLAMPS